MGASAIALTVALGLAQTANAAERITLTNGFDVVCHHHAVIDGRVRLYLKAQGDDYFEVSEDSVSAVETTPDPPPPPEVAVVKPAPAPPPLGSDGKLTASDLHELLAKAGSEHNVDEDLLASVVKTESNGQVRAVSRAGAQGLMQLMPGTARELGVANSFAPADNVRGGTAYLDWLLTRYHDNIALALAAYNAGPQAVDRYHGIPPYRETRAYVARVVHEFNRRVMARQKAPQKVEDRTLTASAGTR